jgi:hypothetical protein
VEFTVEHVPIEENEAQRRRLSALVERLSDDDLARADPDGWTVAARLAHIAFWDRWADCLIRRWRSGELPPPTVPAWYDDAMNETLLPQWKALPGRVAASLALDAAETVDREIERAETPVLAAINAARENHLIHRHDHRREHLDRIEALLA